jgi:hypothetical protein
MTCSLDIPVKRAPVYDALGDLAESAVCIDEHRLLAADDVWVLDDCVRDPFGEGTVHQNVFLCVAVFSKKGNKMV